VQWGGFKMGVTLTVDCLTAPLLCMHGCKKLTQVVKCLRSLGPLHLKKSTPPCTCHHNRTPPCAYHYNCTPLCTCHHNCMPPCAYHHNCTPMCTCNRTQQHATVYLLPGTIVYEGRLDARPVAVKRLLRQFYDLAKKEIEVRSC